MKKKKFCKVLLTTLFSLALIIYTSTKSNLFSKEMSTVQAASSVQATFYLVDEAKAWAAYPSIDESSLTYVGTGFINYTSTIWDNSVATKKTIVKNPNSAITWTHVAKLNNQYYVGARLTDETKKLINESNSSNSSSNNTIPSNSKKTPEPHILTRSQILSLNSDSYPSTDYVKWDGFAKYKYDVADGVIPMTLIDDPVYTSMNLPSETISEYMISVSRDNAHVYNETSGDKGTHIIGIGSIYPTKDATIRSNNTLCIGKIKVFGYNKNTKKWEIIKSDTHPAGASLRKLPWESNNIVTVPIKTFSDHIEISVTSDDMKNGVVHFWGNRIAFDKNKYSYYATAYTLWASGNYHTFTGVSAIDLKNGAKGETVAQLNASRGYAATYNPKTVWSTTIPNNVYKAEWGKQLQELFNK